MKSTADTRTSRTSTTNKGNGSRSNMGTNGKKGAERAESAIDLLKQDHAKVRAMLTELTESSNRAVKKRSELLKRIGQELKIHTKLEEDIFYPAFREATLDHELFFEAIEEHRAVEALLLPDLEKTPLDGDQFAGRAKVLKEVLVHHIEEEEKSLFPKAQKAMGKPRLQELGAAIQDHKARLAR